MTLWLVRAGKKGEYEERFLNDKRIYLTWNHLSRDLSQVQKDELLQILRELYPDKKEGAFAVGGGQIRSFVQKMQQGDWVALPNKKNRVIHIGEIKGDYQNDGGADNPYYHYREVKWLKKDIPRTNFPQDILYIMGAQLTICRIDAEERVRAMSKNNWKGEEGQVSSLEEQAQDQIAAFIRLHYKEHKLAELVEALLRAQGYFTRLSPPGPDGGVDILAGRGTLGLAEPHLCVQVKSGEKPLGTQVLDQLGGVIGKFGAKQGLLVSWGGFTSPVEKERYKQFFKIRLWNQKDIIDQLFENYEALDEEMKAQIPLKKLWTLAPQDEE